MTPAASISALCCDSNSWAFWPLEAGGVGHRHHAIASEQTANGDARFASRRRRQYGLHAQLIGAAFRQRQRALRIGPARFVEIDDLSNMLHATPSFVTAVSP